MTEGRYETLIRTALQEAGPAPWSMHDLDRAKVSLTEDFCSALPTDCDKDAVLDWLNSLPADGVADFLDRLNAGREEGV